MLNLIILIGQSVIFRVLCFIELLCSIITDTFLYTLNRTALPGHMPYIRICRFIKLPSVPEYLPAYFATKWKKYSGTDVVIYIGIMGENLKTI